MICDEIILMSHFNKLLQYSYKILIRSSIIYQIYTKNVKNFKNTNIVSFHSVFHIYTNILFFLYIYMRKNMCVYMREWE